MLFCRLSRLRERVILTEQSERIPEDEDYLIALGRATYYFSYLEWGIIWLMETLQPEFLHSASNMTAGEIAKKFSSASESLDKANPDRACLKKLACNFTDLVHDRNSLMHGNPHTAVGGEQRLLYDGNHGHRDWTKNLIKDFSSRTATASSDAGKLLHNGRLQQYHANKL